jgi:hypothetical protein
MVSPVGHKALFLPGREGHGDEGEEQCAFLQTMRHSGLLLP